MWTPDPTWTPSGRAAALLERLASASAQDYIGESVSQLEHALQSAALARDAGASDEAVLAALFHDLGHLVGDTDDMAGLGAADHEALGANVLLAFGCSTRVAELVRHHVSAKRYLCRAKPAYHARLSEASKQTLAHQGGPMTAEEACAFAARSDLGELLALRSWDDRAKVAGAEVPDLETYWPVLVGHLAKTETER